MNSELTAQLKVVGIKAAKSHLESRKRARVNHPDNFALWAYYFVEAAIIDKLCEKMTPQDVDWLNEYATGGYKSKLNALVMEIGREAWSDLTGKKL